MLPKKRRSPSAARNAQGKQPQVLDEESISDHLNKIQKLDEELREFSLDKLLTEKSLRDKLSAFKQTKQDLNIVGINTRKHFRRIW